MAKVDFPDGSLFTNPAAYGNVRPDAKKAKEKGKAGNPGRAAFSRLLEGARENGELLELAPSEETLQQLLDGVHSAGDGLKNHPVPDNIRRYRQAVRNFLHYVVENGFALEERTSRAGLAKRKKYTLVQVADRKLEELALAILSGQAAQIDILARIDEINGLLVDILQ